MMKTRRGFTLLEMTLVSVISIVLLAMAVALTGVVMGLSSVTSRQVEGERTLGRLSLVFRKDVHQAEGVIIPKPEKTISLADKDELICELRLPRQEIVRYRVHGGILRERVGDGGVVTREGFPLDPRYRVGLRQESDGTHTRAVLTLELGAADPVTGQERGARRTWQILAYVGRDQLNPATVFHDSAEPAPTTQKGEGQQ
jgi:type II secretory pathway component PulJ